MNQTKGSILRNCLSAAFGLFLFGTAVHLSIQVNLGASPWDVLVLGISGRTGILYGNISIVISTVLILVDVLVLKEPIGLGTLIDAIVVGKTVDLWNALNLIPMMNGSLPVRIALLVFSYFLSGFSQYLYIRVGLAAGPRDSFQVGLGKRMPAVPIGVVNILILAVVLVIGWLLGGPVGINSFLAPAGLGLSQQLVFQALHFEPKKIRHQNILHSVRILTGGRKETENL